VVAPEPADVAVVEADPFDLPSWLGEEEVTWRAASSVRGSHTVPGELLGGEQAVECDLLAVDVAYPRPVLSNAWRRCAHQQWTHGQVLLVQYDGRLTLAVPGTEFSADRVLECLSRFAKAVGATPTRFAAALRL
jgi:hypothetical protein